MHNVFSILALSSVQSTLEVVLYRTLTRVAPALFWQSSELLTSLNSSSDFPVKNIFMFIGAWILGFMIGPLIGKLILNLFDCYAQSEFAAATMTVAIVPTVLLRYYGWYDARITDRFEQGQTQHSEKSLIIKAWWSYTKWTTGPMMAGFASDAFGPRSSYLAFIIIGTIFTGAIAPCRKDSNHF